MYYNYNILFISLNTFAFRDRHGKHGHSYICILGSDVLYIYIYIYIIYKHNASIKDEHNIKF